MHRISFQDYWWNSGQNSEQNTDKILSTIYLYIREFWSEFFPEFLPKLVTEFRLEFFYISGLIFSLGAAPQIIARIVPRIQASFFHDIWFTEQSSP